MTSRIDYYLLDKSSTTVTLLYCCRLTHKAYNEGLQVFVLASSIQQATKLDQLMWSFSDTSFLPHETIKQSVSPSTLCQIFIGTEYSASTQCNLLINLANKIMPQEQQFERIADIVSSDETNKADARLRYAQRRSQGFEQNLHHIQL